MHSAALITLGFLLIAIQAALAIWLPFGIYTPNLLLPMVVFLGMSSGTSLAKGSAISFVFGYLLDAACALPLGLQTLTMVSSFVIARNASARLFPKAAFSHILLTGLTALLGGAILLALRAIFEAPAPFEWEQDGERILSLLGYALLTALSSPAVTHMQRVVERLLARHGESRSQLGA